MRALGIFAIAASIAVTGTDRAQDLGSDQQRAQGEKLYGKYCSQCHGETGNGVGPATGRVKPAPRDFTSGKYKFRTTPSGLLPTDADLYKVIKDGLPYTSMPGWPNFSDTDIQKAVDRELVRGKRAVPGMLRAMRSEVAAHRRVAASVLLRLSGKDFGFDPDRGPEENQAAIKAAEVWWLTVRGG